MARQKWELRYPVFLLFFLLTPTIQFPPITLEKLCSSCSTACSNKYLQQLSINGSCQTCGCLTNISFLEEFKKKHPRNVPFIYSTPSLVKAGQTADFTCIRWCERTHCSSTNIPINQMYLTGSSQLPDSGQQLRYLVRGGGMWLSILNLTLTVDATNAFDTLNCRIAGRASVFTSIVLFAFELTRPLLNGPKAVVTSQEYSWDCQVNFVLMRVVSRVSERVDFAVEIVDAGPVRSTEDGTVYVNLRQHLLEGRQISKRVVLKVPNRLAGTEFSVQCVAIHREVSVVSKALPIIVTVSGHKESKDIAAKLTTSGAVMASLAVVIAASFAVLYCLRKKGMYPGPYTAEGATTEPSNNRAGGILKGEKNYDINGDKEDISMVKTYSALLEDEPESSVAESGSIVLDEDIQKELSQAITADSAEVSKTPAATSAAAKLTATTAKPTPATAKAPAPTPTAAHPPTTAPTAARPPTTAPTAAATAKPPPNAAMTAAAAAPATPTTAAKPATAPPTAKAAPPATPTKAAPPAAKPAPPSPTPPPPMQAAAAPAAKPK